MHLYAQTVAPIATAQGHSTMPLLLLFTACIRLDTDTTPKDNRFFAKTGLQATRAKSQYIALPRLATAINYGHSYGCLLCL